MKKKLNRVEVIDKVYDYFSRPDAELSFDPVNESCLYRKNYEADNPVRCAFGIFIPDAVYDEGMEDETASDVLSNHKKMDEVVFADDVTPDFLDSLQTLHDNTAREKGSVNDLLLKLRGMRAAYVKEYVCIDGKNWRAPSAFTSNLVK